jgi:hypothetical protein
MVARGEILVFNQERNQLQRSPAAAAVVLRAQMAAIPLGAQEERQQMER